MTCIINNYKFFEGEDGSIEVYVSESTQIYTTFYPAYNVSTQKDFEVECADWYMKNV